MNLPREEKNDPTIYAKVTVTTGADVRYLKIDKNGTIDPLLDILGQTSEIKIDGSNGTKFDTDTTNIAVVTPISVAGVEGDPVGLNFVVDTRLNTSYLEGGVIGNLGSDKKIVIGLSNLEELSGIEEYNYVFTVGDQKIEFEAKDLNGNSFKLSNLDL